MIETILLIGAATGTVSLLVYGVFVAFSRNRTILAERLETYAGIEEEAAIATQAEIQQNAVQRSMNLLFGRGYLSRVQDQLAQADIPMRPTEYILLRAVLAGLGTIVSLWVLPELHDALLLLRTLALAITGFLVPALWVRISQNRRRNRFIVQLADALMLLTNSLRSGYGFLKGLELVAKEMSDPISKELNRVLREINLGATVEQAMTNLGRRVNSPDLDIVISAYLIQKDVGGNLTEIMEKVAETIRERLRIEGDVKVLTAQGRLSGLIVGLLPVFLFLYFLFMTPDYFSPMWGPPLVSLLPGLDVPLGVLWLIGAVVLELIGAYTIFKVVDIKV